jgi:peptide methionine sulfoxide reductase MsrA
MTARLSSDIREAARPIYCSSCFNSQDIRHVDFEAACDRGYGKAEAVQITYDDLIICENCMREGLMVLGIEDSTELKAERDDLKRKFAIKSARVDQLQNYADNLEGVMKERPEVRMDGRKRPRKNIEEVAA